MALSRSSVLHYWSARHGPTPVIGGRPVHTRSSAGRIADQRGVLHAPIINTPRFGWDTLDGERRPALLLEMARTNSFTRSQEFDDAAWTKAQLTVTANAGIAPDGTVTADKLVENTAADAHNVFQTSTAMSNDTTQVISVYAKMAGRRWLVISLLKKDGARASRWFDLQDGVLGSAGGTARISACGDGWYRCVFIQGTGIGATTPRVDFYMSNADNQLGYAGDGSSAILLWGAQLEIDKAFETSYVPTTTAVVTRSADSFYWDFATAPQELAAYIRFLEGGSIVQTAGDRILQIGNSADTGNRLSLYTSAGVYKAYYETGGIGANPALAVAPSIDDTVDLLVTVAGGGTAKIIQSINGAAISSASAVASTLPSSWSDTKLWLNSVGSTAVGRNRFAEVKIVKLADLAGATDQLKMDELRAFELNAAGEVIA